MSYKQWFRGIRLKLFILVMIPVALFTVLGWKSVSSLRSLSDSLKTQGLTRLPLSQHSGEMQTALNMMFRALWATYSVPENPRLKNEMAARFTKAHEEFKEAKENYLKLPRSPQAQEKWKVFEENWPKLEPLFLEVFKMVTDASPENDQLAKTMLLEELRPLVKPIETMFDDLDKARIEMARKDTTTEIAEAEFNYILIICLVLAGSMGLMAFGFIMASNLCRRLTEITEQVHRASQEVSTASEQLSSSSTQLASSAQEQAASVEETSASLEEISGMVQSNTKGAEDSVKLAETVLEVVQNGNKSMEQVETSMGEILSSNERIEKLVKLIEEIGEKTQLIDEIVFQTRLLSFNASVEAERAGDHGRGFAVVAQEVGNLAQMSGKSAIEISSIVKNSVKEAQEIASSNKVKVEKGADLVKTTTEKFQDVIKASERILESSRQILRASEEQNTGIHQINQSVDAINKATQENAATSEESAGGSESLRNQSERLTSLVGELSHIVEGQDVDMKAKKEKESVSFANVFPLKDQKIKRTAPIAVKKAAGFEVGQNTSSAKNADEAWERI